MPSLHDRLRTRSTRIALQAGTTVAVATAVALAFVDEPAIRAIGVAALGVAVLATVKTSLVAAAAAGRAASEPRVARPVEAPNTDGNDEDDDAFRRQLQQLAVRVGALEALDRRAESTIGDLAATRFELLQIRDELDRLSGR